MPQGRPDAGAVLVPNGGDSSGDFMVVGFGELLYDIKGHILAGVSGESINGKGISQFA